MIELLLLGGVSIESDGLSTNARVRQRNPLALLALIAAGAPRPVGRDHLMSLLWPDSDEERARNSLRQTVHLIRKDLGEDVLVSDATGTLQLDRRLIRVDLWDFRDALENNLLEDAVAAYGGPFLDGFRLPGGSEIEEWGDGVARELRLSYIEALDALGRRASQEGRHADAVRLRRALAVVNPLSSRVAASLLGALTDAGDRVGALEYAAVYRRLVEDRLEVELDDSVTRLISELENDPTLGTRPAPPPAPAITSAALPPTVDSIAFPRSVGAEWATRLEPVSVGPDTPSPAGRDSWFSRVALALVMLMIGYVAGRLDRPGSDSPAQAIQALSEPTTGPLVLASGGRSFEGRDQRLLLVECEGPACPDTPLPQSAFLVSRADVYGTPTQGSNYVSTRPDGTDQGGNGFECCTRAVFEMEFELPPEASAARISLASFADNRAAFFVNGQEFGRHEGDIGAMNFLDPASSFSTDFFPNLEGRNILSVTLENGGGLIALQFYALVTWQGEESGG